MAKKKEGRKRRGIEERIVELEAKIAAIKEREARRRAKADPALRHASAAFRAIEKSLAATSDAELRHALLGARSALAPVLGTKAKVPGDGRVRRSGPEVENLTDGLLDYVRNNPGQRSEEIATALALDTRTIRPAMKRLIADGKITTQGERRAMRYSPS
jgi:hypothetical protein